MKTGFVTDAFSTLGGLAAVAYGDVDQFREVQNQIVQNSVTRAFDLQRPSEVFLSSFPSEGIFIEEVLAAVLAEYDLSDSLETYIDSTWGPRWEEKFKSEFLTAFKYQLDSTTSYGVSLQEYIFKALEAVFNGFLGNESLSRSVLQKLSSDQVTGPDVELFGRVSSNNPLNKISTPPPNSIIKLENTTGLSSDYRGVSFSSGYLPPPDYYSEVAYPSLVDRVGGPSFKEAVLDGYVGYPQLPALFESYFNPAGAQSLQNVDISYSGDTPWSASSSILGELMNAPGLSRADQQIYDVSIMGAKLNGFTSFDPKTMSNGDYFNGSLLPKDENNNNSIFSTQPFSSVF